MPPHRRTNRRIDPDYNSNRKRGVNQDEHGYERRPVRLVTRLGSEVSGDGERYGTYEHQRCDDFGGTTHSRTVGDCAASVIARLRDRPGCRSLVMQPSIAHEARPA
jgi:hypothetical protein